MLTLIITILIFLSYALIFISVLLITGLFKKSRKELKRSIDADIIQEATSGINLDEYGFKAEFNTDKGQAILIPLSLPEIKAKFTIQCGDRQGDKEINPSFGRTFRWDELDPGIRENLMSAGGQLTPFYDFMIIWAREIKQVVIKRHKTLIDFRLSHSLPVDVLSDLLRDAAAAFTAFYNAASAPPQSDDSPETKYPQPWFTNFRRELEQRSAALIIGLLVLIASAATFVWHMHGVLNDRRALAWPSVEGEITLSRVNRTVSTRGRGKDRTTTVSYLAEFKYRYMVGILYENDQYSFFLTDINGEEDARKASNEFPEGSKVRVYYNPDNPRDSVLKRHGDTIGFGHLALWLCIYLFPVLPLYYYRRLTAIIRNARQRLAEVSETGIR